MHYDTATNRHGLKHDPFKALVVPRPIGWIATLGRDGRRNLAPYSFFNAVSDRPPIVLFSSAGRKDTLRNIEETGEFTCSIACWHQRDAMNLSSAPVAPGVDEFALAGLEPAESKLVKVPRVAGAPAAFECRHWKTVELPAVPGKEHLAYSVVFGEVVAIYIDDAYVADGQVDTGRMRPLARLGYMDYSVVTPETMFSLNRPMVSEDGRSAQLPSGEWDGVYR
jgi:flavin reductase (DIM6/NTAB) family NADH-FMN oxidoreductase RutF